MSFLSISPLGLDRGDNAYFGVRKFIAIEKDATDIYYIFRQNDRLENVAYKYYGSVDYWWVLADINNIANPLEIEAGTSLRIVSLARIEQAISEAQDEK